MLHKVYFDPNPSDAGGGAPTSMDALAGSEQMTEQSLQPIQVNTSGPQTQPREATPAAVEVVTSPAPGEEGNTREVHELGKGDKVISLADFGETIPDLLKGDDKPVVDKAVTAPVVAKPAVAAQPAKAGERDYSMFRPEHAEIIKKSRNEVYDFARQHLPNIYKAENEARERLKQVETKVLPDSYWQHPSAFALSSEYQSAQTDAQFASFEERHWEKQLIALKSGNTKLNMLKGFDDKGSPVFEAAEIKPEDATEMEIKLTRSLNASSQAKANAYRAASDIQRGFQITYTQVVEGLKSAEDKYYPFYKTPNEAQKKTMTEIEGMIPSQFRSSPLASYLVKSGTLNVELVNLLDSARKEIAALKAGHGDAGKRGPNGSEITSTGGNSKGKKLSLADFGD